MDCLNIMQMIAKINNPKKFDKLAFFIYIADDILMIPKIIVFVDSLDKKITLAYHLCNLFSIFIKKDIEKLIQILNLILESDIKAQYLEDFCDDNIKI